MKVCFLASGGGGNFKFFHFTSSLGIIKDVELFLIADRECGALEYARRNKVYNRHIKYTRKENIQLLEELEKINPNYIVTNWHKILDSEVVDRYRGKLINLHYSLLPAFGGLIGIEPIKKAYEKNCQYVGVTCHYVDENVDNGKIISQAIVKADIPIEEAIQRVFEKGCLILLNSIIILSGMEIIPKFKNEKFEFSPNLLFNDAIFDERFWKKVKTL